MAGRLTQQELRDEVHAMCRRGGINPADVTVVFPAALEAEHCRNLRRYAQVDLDATRFEFSTSVLDLPDVYREAVIAHEVGHVVAEREWGASSEKDADVAAADFLGVEIDYDKAWPGKGLQMKTNPTRSEDQAFHDFTQAMIDPSPESSDIALDIALEQGWKLRDLGARVLEVASGKRSITRGKFWFSGDRSGSITWHVEKLSARAGGGFELQYLAQWADGTPDLYVTTYVSSEDEPTEQTAADLAARRTWSAQRAMKETYGQYGRVGAREQVRRILNGAVRPKVPREVVNPVRTDAHAAFVAAMRDPDPSSTAIAQDILLENNLKLADVSSRIADKLDVHLQGYVPEVLTPEELGTFELEDKYPTGQLAPRNRVTWCVVSRAQPVFSVIYQVTYDGTMHSETVRIASTRGDHRTERLQEAIKIAAQSAWATFAIMKEAAWEGLTWMQFDQRVKVFGTERANEQPKEINPSRSSDEAIDAFDKAMIDPDPSSTTVAQDIAEENGMKLRDLGARHSPDYKGRISPRWGRFWFDGAGRSGYASWSVVLDEHRPFDGLSPDPRLLIYWMIGSATGRVRDAEWERALERGSAGSESLRPGRKPTYADEAAYERQLTDSGAARAWATLAVMKEHYDSPDLAARIANLKKGYPSNDALKGNPMPKKNPDDVAAARDKYEEFHRYAPKKEIFEKSFSIPTKMRKAGKAKWVTYRSSKVDPATLKKPKKPVDYIHEHNAGVHTYLPDDPDTDVPSSYRQVDALVKLGENLGFCFVDDDGEEIEAEGQGKLPKLYSTPDGKCLLVIQDRKKVLAMMWGGGLGVFARGIDG